MTNFNIACGVRRRKHRLFMKMAKRYLQSHLTKQPSLRFMDIALGYNCNFDCRHCSASILDHPERSSLSLMDYERVAESAMEAGVLAFHFTGGEPLVQKDLFEIIKRFKPQENLISIQTNGWLADDAFLRKYEKMGGDIVCVSVDSANPKIHDTFRRKAGSWNKAIASLKSAREIGLHTLISFTLTHFNIMSQDFKDMIRLSKSLGSILCLNLAVPAGKWAAQWDYLLTSQDREALNTFLSENTHVRTDFESNWRVRGCPAFKEKCYLTPYGDVLPCPFIHISFGNILNMSLKDIRAKALRFDYLKQYHPICIAAEDRVFIEKAGCYNADYPLLPIYYSKSPFFMSDSVG